jgi:hypothetical protein
MRWWPIVLVLVLVALGSRAQPPPAFAAPASPVPGPLVTVPPDYRNWLYASASLALSYPAEEAKLTSLARAHLPPAKTADQQPALQNVFVSPDAYKAFAQTGHYPDKTVFVLEVRAGVPRQSKFLSPGGLYQGDIVAMRMEMRDDARYPSKWAWFNFTQPGGKGTPWVPTTPQPEPAANCLQCHVLHGAVDDSFTQFYPTLFAIAKAKGTVKPNYAH